MKYFINISVPGNLNKAKDSNKNSPANNPKRWQRDFPQFEMWYVVSMNPTGTYNIRNKNNSQQKRGVTAIGKNPLAFEVGDPCVVGYYDCDRSKPYIIGMTGNSGVIPAEPENDYSDWLYHGRTPMGRWDSKSLVTFDGSTNSISPFFSSVKYGPVRIKNGNIYAAEGASTTDIIAISMWSPGTFPFVEQSDFGSDYDKLVCDLILPDDYMYALRQTAGTTWNSSGVLLAHSYIQQFIPEYMTSNYIEEIPSVATNFRTPYLVANEDYIMGFGSKLLGAKQFPSLVFWKANKSDGIATVKTVSLAKPKSWFIAFNAGSGMPPEIKTGLPDESGYEDWEPTKEPYEYGKSWKDSTGTLVSTIVANSNYFVGGIESKGLPTTTSEIKSTFENRFSNMNVTNVPFHISTPESGPVVTTFYNGIITNPVSETIILKGNNLPQLTAINYDGDVVWNIEGWNDDDYNLEFFTPLMIFENKLLVLTVKVTVGTWSWQNAHLVSSGGAELSLLSDDWTPYGGYTPDSTHWTLHDRETRQITRIEYTHEVINTDNGSRIKQEPIPFSVEKNGNPLYFATGSPLGTVRTQAHRVFDSGLSAWKLEYNTLDKLSPYRVSLFSGTTYSSSVPIVSYYSSYTETGTTPSTTLFDITWDRANMILNSINQIQGQEMRVGFNSDEIFMEHVRWEMETVVPTTLNIDSTTVGGFSSDHTYYSPFYAYGGDKIFLISPPPTSSEDPARAGIVCMDWDLNVLWTYHYPIRNNPTGSLARAFSNVLYDGTNIAFMIARGGKLEKFILKADDGSFISDQVTNHTLPSSGTVDSYRTELEAASSTLRIALYRASPYWAYCIGGSDLLVVPEP